MRHGRLGVAALGLAGLLLAGCESDTDSRGLASITITDEDEEVVPGNRCAVSGNATNSGNSRARVRITYQAKNGQGTVIATSPRNSRSRPSRTSSSANSRANNQGQPSSGAFVPPVSCGAIADIDRKDLDVDAI